MIDCYRTPEDLHNWRTSQQEAARRRIAADPRYWGGQLYATVTDRVVAEARATVRWAVASAARRHSEEMAAGVRLGDARSWWRTDGRRK